MWVSGIPCNNKSLFVTIVCECLVSPALICDCYYWMCASGIPRTKKIRECYYCKATSYGVDNLRFECRHELEILYSQKESRAAVGPRLRGFFLTDKAAGASRRPHRLVPMLSKLRMSGVTPLHTHTHTHTHTLHGVERYNFTFLKASGIPHIRKYCCYCIYECLVFPTHKYVMLLDRFPGLDICSGFCKYLM
jgi:hypothetical protein